MFVACALMALCYNGIQAICSKDYGAEDWNAFRRHRNAGYGWTLLLMAALALLFALLFASEILLHRKLPAVFRGAAATGDCQHHPLCLHHHRQYSDHTEPALHDGIYCHECAQRSRGGHISCRILSAATWFICGGSQHTELSACGCSRDHARRQPGASQSGVFYASHVPAQPNLIGTGGQSRGCGFCGVHHIEQFDFQHCSRGRLGDAALQRTSILTTWTCVW